MKRGDFLKHLKANGCEFFREGSKHTVYMNTVTGKKVTVPRHKELHNDFCKEMCKQLEIPVIHK
jgi:predicted RNA binding protein YcfA (HicA-like mRNA interferase family)